MIDLRQQSRYIFHVKSCHFFPFSICYPLSLYNCCSISCPSSLSWRKPLKIFPDMFDFSPFLRPQNMLRGLSNWKVLRHSDHMIGIMFVMDWGLTTWTFSVENIPCTVYNQSIWLWRNTHRDRVSWSTVKGTHFKGVSKAGLLGRTWCNWVELSLRLTGR